MRAGQVGGGFSYGGPGRPLRQVMLEPKGRGRARGGISVTI